MSFFSYEYSDSKMTLLTKTRFWGLLPLAISCSFSYLLLYLFRRESVTSVQYWGLSVILALITFILLNVCHQYVCKKGNAMSIYFALALIPIFCVGYCLYNYSSPISWGPAASLQISLSIIICLIISLIAGIWIAFHTWKYAYKNYHYDPSDFHTTLVQETNGDGTMWKYSFTRSVEAFVLTFATIAPLFAVFV